MHVFLYLNICHIPILIAKEKQSYRYKMFFPLSLWCISVLLLFVTCEKSKPYPTPHTILNKSLHNEYTNRAFQGKETNSE